MITASTSGAASSSPWHFWAYFNAHRHQDLSWLWDHVWLSALPVVIGLAIALPLGWVASRYKWIYPPMLSVMGLLYTIPSIALFVIIPPLLGLKALNPIQVPIALTIYSVALLVRVVADGLSSVPEDVLQAATAMGFGPIQRLFKVELPIAVPVIAAGLRVATVSNVSIVAVAGTIGLANLGQLFTTGFQLSTPTAYYPPIVLGIVLCVALALAFDGVIVTANRLLTPVAQGGAGPMIGNVFGWLTTAAHWRGGNGMTAIGTQIQAHITYSFVAVAIALAIALPLGLFIGHTGRLPFLVSAANTLRALPTVGVLILLTVMIAPNFHGRTDFGYLVPTEIVLVLIAIPPILSNTHAGVQNVDGVVRDAASAMGMTGSQVLLQVELPNSLPLIFSGLRSASLQVIATATIASYLPLGGLGRFIYDGLAQQDFPQMIGGGVLVALLALLTDSVLAFIQRHVVSRGVSGRFTKKAMTAGGPAAADIVQAEVAAI